MPPVHRKNVKGISSCSNRSQSTAAKSDTESLQRQCTERGLLNHGQKNSSISWLQQHATTSSSRPTVDATGNANLLSTSTSPECENPQSSLFTEDHLAQIRYGQLFLVPNRTSSVASRQHRFKHACMLAVNVVSSLRSGEYGTADITTTPTLI